MADEQQKQLRVLLVKELEKAMHTKDSVLIGKWYSILITFRDGHGMYECLIPSRGNMRVRIPKGKFSNGEIKYELYRVTNEKDLVHVDTTRDIMPEFNDRTKIKHYVNLNVMK